MACFGSGFGYGGQDSEFVSVFAGSLLDYLSSILIVQSNDRIWADYNNLTLNGGPYKLTFPNGLVSDSGIILKLLAYPRTCQYQARV